jgi:GTP cyclohydrolase I
MDKKKIEKGVRMILEGMGEDPDREGLVETPARVARMYEEIFAGYGEDASAHLAKQFSGCNTDLILEKDIPFYSMCEHHMVPFYGKAHIAYIPGKKVAGLSKLARTVEVFAKRLQLQERMTSQIADAIMDNLSPKGVMVVLEAEHLCMTMRGVKKPGSQTVTVAVRGAFAEQPELQNRFFQMLNTH